LEALFLGYFLSLLLFFTNGRYRLPLLTILIPFASFAIHHLTVVIRRRNFKPALLLFAAFSFSLALGLAPVRGSGDRTAYYNMHGAILQNNGDHAEALQFWQASSRMRGSFSAYADLMLASEYHREGACGQARKYLDNISDSSFAAAYKYGLLGDVYASESDYSMAAAAYEKSLSINSGQLSVRQKLVKLLQRLDPARARKQSSALASIASYYQGL